jgi:hypothetical protein
MGAPLGKGKDKSSGIGPAAGTPGPLNIVGCGRHFPNPINLLEQLIQPYPVKLLQYCFQTILAGHFFVIIIIISFYIGWIK